MTCLQAFLAGFVLGLGLARVSPSGKARASQARMRGFESRHPLQDNLKPAFGRTTPHGWLFVRRRAFLIHELKNFRRLCKIYLATAIHLLQKQKSQYFCNFFSIRNSLSFLQSKNEPEFRWLPAVLRLGLRSKRLTTIPNRKNLAIQTDFLFSDPKTTSHQRSGQDRVVVMPRVGWGGHDAAGRMGQSQRRGQGGSVATSQAGWTGRTALKTQKEWRAFPFHSYVGTRCPIEARSAAGIYKRLEYHSLRMVFLP